MSEIQHQPSQAGATVEQGFDSTAITRTGDTAATAMAEQAKHAISARYQMAMLNPRNWDTVRANLMRICKHPSFADSAIYSKPVGGQDIKGPSIRFIEQALREMGNVFIDMTSIYDDDEKGITRVTVMDLETNITYTHDVTVQKTIERKRLKKNQVPLSTRTNSYGELLYILRATDDEIMNKKNALISKAIRNGGVRVLPPDIMADCMAMCESISSDKAAEDPEAAKKKLIDGFGRLNVTPAMLKARLGHEIGTASPDELAQLRKVWAAIDSGEATWADVMGEEETKGKGSKGLKDKLGKGKDDLLTKLMAKHGMKPADVLGVACRALSYPDELTVEDFEALVPAEREQVAEQLASEIEGK